jgi:type II secretory pathway pseudopilin PulG
VNRVLVQLAVAGALAALAGPALAAGKAKVSPEQAAYNQERARCMRGDSGQDRATCLKEAGAAYDEARRGRLANKPGADLAGNATRRCEAQPAADRDACVQRILGAGKAEGSVQGGGLIRETETKVK